MATSKDRNMRAEKRTISLQDAVRMLVESDNESEDVITSNAYDSNELETENENERNEDDTDDCGGKQARIDVVNDFTKNQERANIYSIPVYASLCSAGSAALNPANKVGPRNIPDSIAEDSKPCIRFPQSLVD